MGNGVGNNPLSAEGNAENSIPQIGVMLDTPINILEARRSSDLLVLTATTSSSVPAIAGDSTTPKNVFVRWDSQATVAAQAVFNVTIPGEYNPERDELVVLAAIRKSGAAQVAADMIVAYSSFRPGLVNDLAAAAAVPAIRVAGNSSSISYTNATGPKRTLTAQVDTLDGFNWYRFDLSRSLGDGVTRQRTAAQVFKPLQVLTLYLGPATTLDASVVIDCAGLVLRCRKGLALNDKNARYENTSSGA